MATPPTPPNPGGRLLPSLVDEIASTDPGRIFYSVAKTRNPADGFYDVSAQAFARAVDRFAWHIERNLGRGHNFPTITYMGPQDVVYAIAILASIKTGYKLLLNSPRNTLESHLSLFEKTECHTFLLPPNFPLPVIQQILAARQMKVLEIPGAQHWLEEGPHEPYPYTKTFAEAKSEPFVALHTSGSTGLPKPVTQVHATHSPLDAFTALPSLGMKKTYPAMCAGARVYLTFPLFHCAGVAMLLPASIYAGFTVVLGPFPPSADTANAVHVHGNVQQSCLAPMTLMDLVKNDEHLENLGRLTQITYGGGPCPPAVGDLVSSKTRLLNCLGTTECGVLPIQLCDPGDWPYMSVSPMLGHEYRHVSEDLYEQVIVRDPKLDGYQGIFATFPDLNEWPMRDLYSKHPTKDVWLYRGRSDDIIVFSNGEKLNPNEMESTIMAHHAVSAALIAGLGRFQSSLLVEAVQPPTDKAAEQELLEAIWPSVEAANKLSPSHGRIHRNMVIFTSPGKPMLRAGKGTVQRQLTVDLYAPELDALYEASNDLAGNLNGGSSHVVNGAPASGSGNILDAVRNIIATSTDIDVNRLSHDADLFELGLDSLQVTLITRKINELLSQYGKPTSADTRTVYSNPSLGSLAASVSALAEGKSSPESTETDEQKMQKLNDLYTANLPLSARQAQPIPSDRLVVLLTGSTGTVGAYVLDALLRDPRVRYIYCLNRGPGSLERQQKSQAGKGLQPPTDKVQCLDADFSKPYFGLSTQQYMVLLNEVTTVIHNAWQVDFNLSVDSFATQIAASRRLVDFSALSKFGARLAFVSSVSAVAGLAGAGRIPEQVYEDWATPQAIGYGQAKFVTERLLDAAAKEAGVPATILRLGQVAGPTTEAGVWPKQEWLPSLIASSKYLGKLPESLGQMEVVDWVPVDIVGRSIVELTLASGGAHNTGCGVYHLANPTRTTWKELTPAVTRSLDPVGGVAVVPLEAWVQELRDSASGVERIAQNPAIKILDFFEGLASKQGEPVLLDTTRTASVLPALGSIGPIQEKLVENWMKQWGF